MKISDDVMRVLDRSTVCDGALFLPVGQLDRKLYTAVNKALTCMGGKWNRKAKGHVFDDDVDAEALLEQAIATGEVLNKQQELGYFPTPAHIVKQMVAQADIKPGQDVLEPSAGKGAIVERLLAAGANVHACEAHEPFRLSLCQNPILFVTENDDFLAYNPGPVYDAVVANPPFGRQQDLDHVSHMLDLLKDGGVLVSVMCASVKWRDNRKTRAFRQRLDAETDWDILDLPEGSFKDAGTMVNTVILVAHKNAA